MKSLWPLFSSPLLWPRSSRTYDSHKNVQQTYPVVQTHLKQVYVSLCYSLIASAVGASLHMLWNIGGFLTTFATFRCLCWLLATSPSHAPKRVSLLMAFSLLRGASIGPVIKQAIDFDPSILVCAFMRTAMITSAFFSGAAMLARRRKFPYLKGLLSSGVSILSWLYFVLLICSDPDAPFQLELYLGKVVYVGYMVIHTRETIEKATHGDGDYVKHAVIIFNNFIAVFAINIIILKDFDWKE